MKHQAAYSLLHLATGKAPSQDAVAAFMKECGVSVDNEALAALFTAIGDRSLSELQAAGRKNFISMPCGGGGGARPAAAASGAAGAAPAEDKKEKEEEEQVDMGGLFGDEDEY